MKRSVLTVMVGAIALFLGACASSSSDSTSDATSLQMDVMRRAVSEDLYAAGIRDRQSGVEGASVAVANYVQSLDEIELAHAPANFVAAMKAHRDSWAALIEPLQAFSGERTDMHHLLERLQAMPAPTGPQFQGLVNQITSSWSQVQQIAQQGGVNVW